MSFWREDPEGMDQRIVDVMKDLGHAKDYEKSQVIVDRFNSPQFQKREASLEVADAAMMAYTNDLVGAAEGRME